MTTAQAAARLRRHGWNLQRIQREIGHISTWWVEEPGGKTYQASATKVHELLDEQFPGYRDQHANRILQRHDDHLLLLIQDTIDYLGNDITMEYDEELGMVQLFAVESNEPHEDDPQIFWGPAHVALMFLLAPRRDD